MMHDLKTVPDEFRAIEDGTLRFQLRLNDRNFAMRDQLCLKEFDPRTQKYSGKKITVDVTYLQAENGAVVSAQYVLMSIRPLVTA